MKEKDKKAFVEYKVTLQDSDPPTDAGKENLKVKLIDFLALDKDQVQDLINSMPAILKTGVSKKDADSFAKVLRELGALVFVEKTVEDTTVKPAKLKVKGKNQQAYKNPIYIAIFVSLLGLITASFFFKSSNQPGLSIDNESIAKMIVDIKEKKKKQAQMALKKEAAKKVVWYGKKYRSPVAISIEVLEKDEIPIIASVKWATESPGELNPQELIRGVQSVWLKEGEAIFQDLKNSEKGSRELTTEAKIYFSKQGSSERFVTSATLEKVVEVEKKTDTEEEDKDKKKKKSKSRTYKFSLEHQPRAKFLGEPFYIEYTNDKGYSIILNQEIELLKKEDKEDTNISKILDEGVKSKTKVK